MNLKNSRNIVAIILLLFSATIVEAQNYTLSGYVKDIASGEALIGANVYDSISLNP